MSDFRKVKKVCSFYISRTHFITMILPYINQEIEKKNIINTFLEYNFEPTINEVIEKIILSNSKKEKILNINWNNTKIFKANEIEKKIRNVVKNTNENIQIIVSGSNDYINKVNIIIDKYLKKNIFQSKNITIINSYEVDFFNNNIKEILEKHDYILNTSGLNKIEEVFEGYEKKKIN